MGTRCDVWLLNARAARATRAAAAALLDDDERARAARFRFDRDRALYELAHGLVRAVLGEIAGCRPGALAFEAAAHGKPHLVAPARATPLSFNLSHTHGLVGVAVTRGREVGFDIESTRRTVDPLEVGETVFAPPELGALRALPPDRQRERFFRLWVLKEAYIKARGMGMSLDLQSFRFDLTDGDALSFTPAPDDDAPWAFAARARGRAHRWAVAVPDDDLDVHEHDGAPVVERA